MNDALAKPRGSTLTSGTTRKADNNILFKAPIEKSKEMSFASCL